MTWTNWPSCKGTWRSTPFNITAYHLCNLLVRANLEVILGNKFTQ